MQRHPVGTVRRQGRFWEPELCSSMSLSNHEAAAGEACRTLYTQSVVTVDHTTSNTVVQLLSCIRFLATTWTAAYQPPQSSTIFQNLLKLMSTESVMPSNHLISVVPFSSCLQSFPASGSLPMSQLFASGGQRIGVSASVFAMNLFWSKGNKEVALCVLRSSS